MARLAAALRRIDPGAAAAARRRAEGVLAERAANHAKAQRDLERITSLRATRSASQNEYDDAVTETERTLALVEQAEADVRSREAAVRLLETRIGDMTITAPFAGRVAERAIESGEWASQGAPVALLIATDTVDVWIDVPQQHLQAATHDGASVTFEVPALGRSFEAPVSGVVPIADPSARTFPVRITIDSEDEALRPGMNVVARIPVGTSAPTLVVPRDAMLRDDAGWFVYTATGERNDSLVAVPARVEQLFSVSRTQVAVRVISGPLFPGAPVVVEGNERILFPGQPLRITNPDALAPAETGAPARGGEDGGA